MAKRTTRQTARGRGGARRVRRSVPRGCIHINTSFNNTIITVTDPEGNVLRWLTPGVVGFKGTRKSTPFAARVAAERASADSINNDGMREVDVFVRGAGPGREAALRAIAAAGLRVRSIVDATPIPHNGCRPPKRRRI
jgi:small subunit ribosomal protein S11